MLCLFFSSNAFALDGSGEFGTNNDLRLRLTDRIQELRTTSINWIDLKLNEDERLLEVLPKVMVDVPRHSDLNIQKKFRIAIDAGHGGRDYGAQGLLGISEKSLCLTVSRLVKKELERYQKMRGLALEVMLIRESDLYVPLRERVRRANDWNADLFVSVHGNASDYPKARGFEVYFLNAEASDAEAKSLAHFENDGRTISPIKADVLSILSDVQATQHVEESSHFAESVFRSMALRLRSNGRGVRQAPFTVLAGTTMPALLLEIGYLTHRDDAQNLTRLSYLKRLASAISSGIIEFATLMKKLG